MNGRPWGWPAEYWGYGQAWRGREAWRGDDEWEEKHMAKESYRILHRLLKNEEDEAHKIDEIYYLVHEIARALYSGEAPAQVPAPTPMPGCTMPYVPVMGPGAPVVSPGPAYPCPQAPIGLGSRV
ncbi:MAG: hypothetical protein VB144_02085 [Clostridia bacterium]|nr:hypothetical protein [Clostridia bacterium]